MIWSRSPRRPGRGPVLLSLGVHLLLVVAAWSGDWAADDEIEYVTYQMQLITEAELEALESPPIVETPNLPPPTPEPEPEPEIAEPDPEPSEEPEPEEAQPEPEPEPPPPEASDQPDAEAQSTSTEAMAVRMEGLRRDYPQYYNQIVREITRCFRWNGGGSWTAVLRFEIRDDGNIPESSIEIYAPSASGAFNIEAFGAVACAGGGRLEPLPPDLPYEALPVQFTFQPT